MPYVNGGFVNFQDYVDANQGAADDITNRDIAQTDEQYNAALASMRSASDDAEKGIQQGGTGQLMDYGAYRDYQRNRAAVAAKARGQGQSSSMWDDALMEGTGNAGKAQAAAQGHLADMDQRNSYEQSLRNAQRSQYVKDQLRKREEAAKSKLINRGPPGSTWAPPKSATEDTQRTASWNEQQRGNYNQARTNPGDRTQRVSNLDWMLRSGRITTDQYDRAQTDDTYFQQLNSKYG